MALEGGVGLELYLRRSLQKQNISVQVPVTFLESAKAAQRLKLIQIQRTRLKELGLVGRGLKSDQKFR